MCVNGDPLAERWVTQAPVGVVAERAEGVPVFTEIEAVATLLTCFVGTRVALVELGPTPPPPRSSTARDQRPRARPSEPDLPQSRSAAPEPHMRGSPRSLTPCAAVDVWKGAMSVLPNDQHVAAKHRLIHFRVGGGVIAGLMFGTLTTAQVVDSACVAPRPAAASPKGRFSRWHQAVRCAQRTAFWTHPYCIEFGCLSAGKAGVFFALR